MVVLLGDQAVGLEGLGVEVQESLLADEAVQEVVDLVFDQMRLYDVILVVLQEYVGESSIVC